MAGQRQSDGTHSAALNGEQIIGQKKPGDDVKGVMRNPRKSFTKRVNRSATQTGGKLAS